MDPLPPQKSLLRIRTFAKDLEAARQKTGQSVPADVPVPPKAAPTPVLGSAISSVKAPVEPTFETPSIGVPAFHELKKTTPEKKTGPVITKPTVTENPVTTVRVKVKKKPVKPTPVQKGADVTFKEERSVKVGFIHPLRTAVSSWFSNLFTKTKPVPTTVSTEVVDTPRVESKETEPVTTELSAISLRAPKKDEPLEWSTTVEQPTSSHPVDVTWTPNTEPGYALLGDKRSIVPVSNISIEFKKQAAPVYVEPITLPSTPRWEEVEDDTPTPRDAEAPQTVIPPTPPLEAVPAAQVLIVEPEPIITNTPQTASLSTPQEIITPIVYQEIVQDEGRPQEPIVAPQQLKEVAALRTTNNESVLTTPEAHSKVRALGNITNLNTNALSLGVVGVITGLVLFIIIMRTLFNFIITESSQNTTVQATPITSQTTVSDIIIPSLTPEVLLTNSTPSGEQVLRELRLVDEAGDPIPTATVLDLFGFTNNRTFIGSVTAAHLAIIGNERVIIVSVSDPTAAFGSLLGWEDAMPTRLSQTLSIPPLSEQEDGFKDQTIGTSDVRIYSIDSKQVLVYGFINRNTVVFTNNVATFSAILGAVE